MKKKIHCLRLLFPAWKFLCLLRCPSAWSLSWSGLSCWTTLKLSCNLVGKAGQFEEKLLKSEITFIPLRVKLTTSLSHLCLCVNSEGQDGFPGDNINCLLLPVRYQADLLFTRWGPPAGYWRDKQLKEKKRSLQGSWTTHNGVVPAHFHRDPNPPRFEIKADSSYTSSSASWDQSDQAPPTFNLTYYVSYRFILIFLAVMNLCLVAGLFQSILPPSGASAAEPIRSLAVNEETFLSLILNFKY